jgi:hypothetical protein
MSQLPSADEKILAPISTSLAKPKKTRQHVINLLAIFLGASFFLPWSSGGSGESATGFQFQAISIASKLLWAMPLLALTTLVLGMINFRVSLIRRLAGIVPFLILAYAVNKFGPNVLPTLAFGAWIALFCGALLVLLPEKDAAGSDSLKLIRPRAVEVLEHWYVPVANFNTSTREFYDTVERVMKVQNLPGLDIFRVDFAEGGLLSDKRQYLRMTRERLVFDICAAPFGTGFFFSCRLAEISAKIGLWQVFSLLVSFSVISKLTIQVAGLQLGICALLAGLLLISLLLRSAASPRFRDLDAHLVKSPLFGAIYQRFFRKETYYRYDTRLMYLDVVNQVVKAKVEETTGSKGIKLLRFNERSPLLSELYRPRIVQLNEAAVAA